MSKKARPCQMNTLGITFNSLYKSKTSNKKQSSLTTILHDTNLMRYSLQRVGKEGRKQGEEREGKGRNLLRKKQK